MDIIHYNNGSIIFKYNFEHILYSYIVLNGDLGNGDLGNGDLGILHLKGNTFLYLMKYPLIVKSWSV